MRVRDWRDIVRDVVEADVEPKDWRAIAGPRHGGIGEDLYLAHPRTGVYLLKTYPKNPFEVKGVGTKLSSSFDEELSGRFPEESTSRFGVQPRPQDEDEAKRRASRLEETVKTHADAPTTPDALFEDIMDAIESPAFGPLKFDSREQSGPLDELSGTFEEAERALNDELEELLDRDSIGRGFD